jgi:hypothetical protein
MMQMAVEKFSLGRFQQHALTHVSLIGPIPDFQLQIT